MPSAIRCRQGFEASLKQYGGTKVGGDLTPLGTTDFSSYLIQAQAANPDVIIFLHAGQDMVNALKQAVQFGLDKRFHIAGAQQELEVLEGLPPEARIGTWVFEWYWKQPNVPHVAEFVAAIRKARPAGCRRRAIGSASPRPGPARSLPTQRRRSSRSSWPRRCEGFKLPPEIALMPDEPFYPRRQISADARRCSSATRSRRAREPDDLFKVDQVVKGTDAAGTVEETGCQMNGRPEHRALPGVAATCTRSRPCSSAGALRSARGRHLRGMIGG